MLPLLVAALGSSGPDKIWNVRIFENLFPHFQRLSLATLRWVLGGGWWLLTCDKGLGKLLGLLLLLLKGGGECLGLGHRWHHLLRGWRNQPKVRED